MLNDPVRWGQQNLDHNKATGKQLRFFINCKGTERYWREL